MSTESAPAEERRRGWIPYALLAATAAAAGASVFVEHRLDADRDARRFDALVSDARRRIEYRLARQESLVESLAAAFASDSVPTDAAFRGLVDSLDVARRFPNVAAVGFARRGAGEGRDAVREPVVLVDALGGPTATTPGADLLANPVRRAAMDRACDDGAVVASARLPVDLAGAPGFALFAPAYRPGAPLADAAARRDALVGHAFLEIRGDAIVEAALARDLADLAVFKLYAADRADPTALLHRAAGRADEGARTSTTRFSAAGATWTLVAHALPAFEAQADGGDLFVVLVVGAAIGAAVFVALRSHHAAAHASRRADEESARADDAVLESEKRFREISEHIGEVVWVTGPDGVRLSYVSPAYEQVWGRAREPLFKDPLAWTEAIHPDDRARVIAEMPKAPLGDYHVRYRIIRPDGTVRHVRDRARPVRDASGAVVRVVGTAADVTDLNDAQEALLKNAEQLRQAQKMEAIGRLAGGVAHDFNNLLTVILGFGQMARQDERLDEALRTKLDQVIAAGERAAVLTQQLLAFSRKQVARPGPLDVDSVLREAGSILTRVIGEDVKLVLELDGALGTVVADRGHMEQVVMNLVVNARDAMPDGGTLTISTRKVDVDAAMASMEPGLERGPHVVISVADTGCGMAPEIRDRLFEPFFTTKEPGKGTGLGLATVYGIVRQAGGHVAVESAPGRGSTFRVYLPRASATACARNESDGLPPGGRETVLVVEDEPTVRLLATEILECAGYRVLAAADGEEAVGIAARTDAIDLLLTDVVMPGMNGRQTADRVQALHADCAVTFTSGYTDDIIGRHGVLDPATDLVEKPYTRESLLRRVREALDRRRRAAPAPAAAAVA